MASSQLGQIWPSPFRDIGSVKARANYDLSLKLIALPPQNILG